MTFDGADPYHAHAGALLSRRQVLGLLGGVLAETTLPGCLSGRSAAAKGGDARLSARPGTPTTEAARGRTAFNEVQVSGAVYVPTATIRMEPRPLVVFLHGALRTVDYLDGLVPGAESAGVILLAPLSTVGTWDAIRGTFGRDIARLDAALRWVFNRWHIDPARIVISGFSDGGTYSLAVGRANGDLFSRVVAYSPGFLIDVDPVKRLPILITHGTEDAVLPIGSTSRRIVPELRRLGYDIDYRAFAGGHTVPLDVANEVMAVPG